MILNNEEMGLELNIKRYRNRPKLQIGSVIEFLYNDTSTSIVGCKKIKKGKYRVINIREPLMSNMRYLVYILVSNRSNATYEWAISTEVIDYSIEKGYVIQ